MAFSCHSSLISSVCDSSSVFHDLGTLQGYLSVSADSHLGLFTVFLGVGWSSRVLARIPCSDAPFRLPHIKGIWHQCNITGDINLDRMMKVVSAEFLHCKVSIFSSKYLGWSTLDYVSIVSPLISKQPWVVLPATILAWWAEGFLLPSPTFINCNSSVKKSCPFLPTYLFIQLFLSPCIHECCVKYTFHSVGYNPVPLLFMLLLR